MTNNILKALILRSIVAYQKSAHGVRVFFSGLGVSPAERICPFTPTCAAYAAQAVEKHGIVIGLKKAGARVLRCHPWQKPRIDYP